jgi:hypothetical protein
MLTYGCCHTVKEWRRNGELNFFDVLLSPSQSGLKNCVEEHKAKVMQSQGKSLRVPTCQTFGYSSGELLKCILI